MELALVYENESLHKSYDLMKELLVCFQDEVKKQMAEDDSDGSLSFSETVSWRCKSPSEVIEELQRVNTELRRFNEDMPKDPETLKRTYLVSQEPLDHGIQTLSLWLDMKEAIKRHLQFKEAWEAEKRDLQEEISVLTKQKREAEEHADDLKEQLQEEAAIAQAFEEILIEDLQQEANVLKERKRANEERAYVLKEVLENVNIVVENLKEERGCLLERVKVLKKLESKSTQPSGWKWALTRLVKFFYPGRWRRRSKKKPRKRATEKMVI